MPLSQKAVVGVPTMTFDVSCVVVGYSPAPSEIETMVSIFFV